MLGDELKKSLEPIKTSDELLEKTRQAIYEARVKQAQESLDEASSRSARKRSAGMTYFLRAAIPVACALLVIGGMVLVLPKLSKSDVEKSAKTKSRSQASNTAAEEKAYDAAEYAADTTVAANYDLDLQEDTQDENKGKTLSPNTTEESEPNSQEDHAMDGETTIEEEAGSTAPAEDVDFSDKVSYERSVEAGEYTVSIVNGGHALYVGDGSDDPSSSEPQDHKDDKGQGAVLSDFSGTFLDNGSGTPYTIVGLLYEEETQILYMTVRITEEGKGTQYYIMYGVFENGSLDQETINVKELHGN